MARKPMAKPAIKESEPIFIKGARTHNLKNIDVSIPRNKFVVVTGVSGSGKSSLTIDTLFAEGQRRYAESLSAYARQFMERMDKPDVDYIKGLCPAIAIHQKVVSRTPRSTVGTMTEIYDYLRLLYARIGRTISPVSGREVKKDDVKDVVDFITRREKGKKVLLLTGFKRHSNRKPLEEINILLQKGFTRIYGAGETFRIEDILDNAQASVDFEYLAHSNNPVYVLVDRLVTKEFDEDDIHRLSDSVETAFYEGLGECFVEAEGRNVVNFSSRFELDDMQFEEPVPNLFSFNNPFGACPVCEGFGQVLGIDPHLVFPDKTKTIYEGAIAPWRGEKLGNWNLRLIRNAEASGIPIHKPLNEFTRQQMQLLWTGNQFFQGLNDFFEEVEANLYKIQYRVLLSRYRGRTACSACEGYRLRKEALYVKVNGLHIGELSGMPVNDLYKWFLHIKLNDAEQQIAKRLLIEIDTRLKTLLDVGLGYLSLNRVANTLSGGESQRIQLTRSLGSNLSNSLYILDEPSIGLHARDTERLIGVLENLRDLNNTVVVVEHDEMMMRKADHILDMGPLASHLGGELIAAGNYDEIITNKKSLTGKYLSGKLKVEGRDKKRVPDRFLKIKGASENNLRNINVDIPLNVLAVVSGVSGSGKTTLVKQILYPALMRNLGLNTGQQPGDHSGLEGDLREVKQVELVDQNPIGKSSRSNPVTYIKAWDAIRDLYSDQRMSKVRGYLPRHFSFNVDGGRCDTCKGDGEIVVEMQFLADVHLKCDSCKGRRFKDDVLEVEYKNKNIYEVLEMSVDQAIEFFAEDTSIRNSLQPLQDVGLGYIKLGQSSDTLSGGEAQRVKLASFLGKGKSHGKILFIFDEPTTGLHFHDIQKLLDSFNALIDQGNTILVVEHNTEVIRNADWVIDLGPGAGVNGGELVFAGPPEELKKNKQSQTAKFL